MAISLHSMIDRKYTVISVLSLKHNRILASNCASRYIHSSVSSIFLVTLMAIGKGNYLSCCPLLVWKSFPSSIFKRRHSAIPNFLPFFSISNCMKRIYERLRISGISDWVIDEILWQAMYHLNRCRWWWTRARGRSNIRPYLPTATP